MALCYIIPATIDGKVCVFCQSNVCICSLAHCFMNNQMNNSSTFVWMSDICILNLPLRHAVNIKSVQIQHDAKTKVVLKFVLLGTVTVSNNHASKKNSPISYTHLYE